MRTGPSERPSSVKPILVLGKARRIMESFTPDSTELTFTQVLERSRLPASTCLRLLYSLVDEGFLDKERDRYRPGLKLVAWASAGLAGIDIVRRAGPVVEQLRDTTAETACLYIRHGLVRTCVALAETRHPVAFVIRIGQVMSLHAGAGGKVMLAFSDELAEAVMREPLPVYTEDTITEPARMREELERIRARGYALSFAERNETAAGLSAPVFDFTGDLIASLGIVAPVHRLNPETAPTWAPVVMEAARSLSQMVGGREPVV